MARSTCEAIRPLLSALIDDLLGEDERARVKAHLAACPACRERLAEYQAIRQALAALPSEEPPADLERRLRQRLAGHPALGPGTARDRVPEAAPEEGPHPRALSGRSRARARGGG